MDIIAKYKDKMLAVLGDIHGVYDEIRCKVKFYNLTDTVIFQAGDFGIGLYYNNPVEKRKDLKRLNLLNEYLRKRNVFVYVIRGNHDDPAFFDGNHNLTNIVFMRDYDIVEVGDKRIVGIGGAHSIDRNPNAILEDGFGHKIKCRKKDVDWFEDELFVYDKDKVDSLFGINIIITHMSPNFAFPYVLGSFVERWAEQDGTLLDDVKRERSDMTKLFDHITKYNNIEMFIHGHFHKTNLERKQGVDFWSLDKNEFKEIKLKEED